MTLRLARLGSLIVLAMAVLLCSAPPMRAATDTLPDRLSNAEFWALTESISESNGHFLSDNLTSNESSLSDVATRLADRVRPGGVYLGVGPEQNLTYIAAIRPKMAFINDIRRGNLHMHLMYKALFELAADRAEFMSLLYTKPRPSGLSAASSAYAIINSYWDAWTSDDATYQRNLQAITDLLVKKRQLPLSPDDLSGVEKLYHTFYWCGPGINYNVRAGATSCQQTRVSWSELMITVDSRNAEHSFMSSEEAFNVVKTLHSKNLIVPTVGDFAGPKALRAIAAYLKAHDATLSAFYVSNVEQYLRQNSVWPTFCRNVGTMPLDPSSVFIRPAIGPTGATLGAANVLVVPPRMSAPTGRDPLMSIASEVIANNCGTHTAILR